MAQESKERLKGEVRPDQSHKLPQLANPQRETTAPIL